MPNTDTLLSLAEICAAFAGFAALVSVLGRRSDQLAEAVHDLLRLRLVISSSVAGVAAALIPVGLAGYGIEPEVAWRLAAVGFLIFDNGIIMSFVRAYRPVQGAFRPDHLAVGVCALLEVIEQVSLIAIVVGLSFGSASALYVTALIANICQAGFIFVRFVGSTFHHENQLIENPAGDAQD
jgi:O-antigen/teichoic acid export membrane protein